MREVSGQLFQKDAVASKFQASEAYADQEKNVLKLSNKVVITAEKQGLSLSADKVAWLPERQLIEASGHVMLDGRDYSAGPFDRLLATPDLKKAGTPDTFGKQPSKSTQTK